jgi:hypothetical protein
MNRVALLLGVALLGATALALAGWLRPGAVQAMASVAWLCR